MTEAHLVWATWRRILTSDTLVKAMIEPPDDLASLGLTADEAAIFADYASTTAATDQTIFMYRNGLLRNALCALGLVPLSNRLLLESGVDPEEVAGDFTKSIDYRDDGPHMWRHAAAFVAYLAARPELAGGEKQDALALEASAIALVRRIAEQPPASWPDDTVVPPAHDEGAPRYVASRAAAVASSRHDLTPWLENPYSFDVDATLEPVESHWVIYVPNSDAAHTYAELSARAAGVFTHLATPKTAPQTAAELGLAVDDVLEMIDSLASLGVVSVHTAQ